MTSALAKLSKYTHPLGQPCSVSWYIHAFLRTATSESDRSCQLLPCAAPAVCNKQPGRVALPALAAAAYFRGAGVALVQRGFELLAGSRVKAVPVVSASPQVVAGVICRPKRKTLAGGGQFLLGGQGLNRERLKMNSDVSGIGATLPSNCLCSSSFPDSIDARHTEQETEHFPANVAGR
jgi:hypothetical protein